MKPLRKGDPCPCCGQPIKTNDPDVLQFLTEIAERRRIPTAAEVAEIYNKNRS